MNVFEGSAHTRASGRACDIVIFVQVYTSSQDVQLLFIQHATCTKKLGKGLCFVTCSFSKALFCLGRDLGPGPTMVFLIAYLVRMRRYVDISVVVLLFSAKCLECLGM